MSKTPEQWAAKICGLVSDEGQDLLTDEDWESLMVGIALSLVTMGRAIDAAVPTRPGHPELCFDEATMLDFARRGYERYPHEGVRMLGPVRRES